VGDYIPSKKRLTFLPNGREALKCPRVYDPWVVIPTHHIRIQRMKSVPDAERELSSVLKERGYVTPANFSTNFGNLPSWVRSLMIACFPVNSGYVKFWQSLYDRGETFKKDKSAGAPRPNYSEYGYYLAAKRRLRAMKLDPPEDHSPKWATLIFRERVLPVIPTYKLVTFKRGYTDYGLMINTHGIVLDNFIGIA